MTQRTDLSREGKRLLARERAGASFRVEWMTNFLDGGQEKTKRRRELCKTSWPASICSAFLCSLLGNRVFRDPAMADVNYEEFPLLSREELIRRTLKLQAIVLRVILQRKTTHLRDKAYLQRLGLVYLHWNKFSKLPCCKRILILYYLYSL
jgi:hypothetical protein